MNIIKRDESIQEYDFMKIVNAVTKAFNSVEQEVPDKFLEQLKDSVGKTIIKNNGNGTHIEEIQDVIQKELIKRNKYEVVESFINYRRKREEIRLENSDLIKEVEEKLSGKNVQNQNANLDEASFGGRVGEMASVVCKTRALKEMRKQSRLNHEKNEVYIHDLDAWKDGRHNCLTIPFDDLLANGFKTRQTDVRPAGSINTAMQLVAVIFQLQSLQQFGGVSASHLDWTMLPYVRKSYMKNYIAEWIKEQEEFFDIDVLNMTYEAFNKWVLNMTTKFFIETGLEKEDFKFSNENLDEKLRQKSLYDTKRETYQAVEGMYHNLNTLQSRSGNQLPFTSINYGTCTELEGRMVIKALLEVSMQGLGSKGVTSIFPCGIFQYMKGINDKPGTPNYDLKLLALESTSKRIYPNYANVDWSGNVGYDRNDPKTYFSTMGCHALNTPIVMADGSYKMVQDVVVGDKVMGGDGTPRTVLTLIRGNDRLFKVDQSRGESYIVNEGHILALEYSANRKYKNFKKGDKVNMSVHDYLRLPDYIRRHFKGYKGSFELPQKQFDIPPYILGLWLGDGNSTNTRFSVNIKETQILNDLEKYAQSINKNVIIKQDKDEQCFSVDITNSEKRNEGNEFRQALFGYNLIQNKHIPECYFYGSKEQRKALLAGLINTDGWARNGRGRRTVCFGNTNFELIKGAKRLADSLGYTTKIIFARGEALGTGICEGSKLKPYYHLSIHEFDDEHLMSNKKTDVVSIPKRNFNTSTLKITEVESGNFYGFELDGDKLYLFNDCTVTHNCRTANGFDINVLEGQNPQLKDGRGNICPVTVILPTLAVIAKQKVDKKASKEDRKYSSEEVFEEFMKILDKKIGEAKDTLIERFNHIASQSPAAAKFMYENKTMFGYKEEEGIISALKHGTLALGQLGLAETLFIIFGFDHTSDEGMEYAKKIEQLFKDRCAEYKQEYKLNFGVYYTPAENLCYTAMKNFRKRFKDFEQEFVTYFIDENGNKVDKIYFTNSIHVPVWHDIDAYKKIDIESQLTGYSSAGCITYVELPSKCHDNIKAVEDVVDYMMEHDIPYGAINIPLNRCACCGEPIYDESLGKCPKCGCEEIIRLGRITGYLSTDVGHFNLGKQAEFGDRVKHFKH